MRGTLITERVSWLQEITKVTSGTVTAPADPAAARGGPWFKEPPNTWNTKICCEFIRTRLRSSRKRQYSESIL